MVSEEHEDNLLHEALLCLKGLCTTDLALQKLREIADVLFPALIGMLFDEEHKGPSEFTTRQIIINLLCMYTQVISRRLILTLHSQSPTSLQHQRKISSHVPGPSSAISQIQRSPNPTDLITSSWRCISCAHIACGAAR